MTPQLLLNLKIIGGSVMGALIVDLKNWASAPKDEDGRYPPYDFSCAIRHATLGFITGLGAVGVTTAT